MPTPHPTSRRPWRWAAPDEWDAVVAASPCATPFHTRAWCETYAAYDKRFEARALTLRLERGADVLLPLFVRRGAWRRGPLARAVAAQPGVYGGPLSPQGRLGDEAWSAFARELPRLPFGQLDFFGNVLDPLPARAAAELGASVRTTHAIALGDLPADSRSTFSKGCKHALTKAKRAGVTCARVERPDEVEQYFEVYLDSVRRWGKEPGRAYRLELFQRLLGSRLAELWAARLPSGEIAACGAFLFHSRHCVWWHGAMRAEHAEAAPSNALVHALIDEARSRGCELFDFNPSGGHEGVDSFKRSFGAESIEFSIWSHRSPIAARFGGAARFASRARRARGNTA